MDLGAVLTQDTALPTKLGPHELETTPLDQSRFVAGTLLAGRYRIVGLLSKGGMGEVYKAEDLKLRQLVALKFLPESLSADGPMLARFHNEVRAARQITHANVCRVHDIGETLVGRHSLHFLSMEYIDGEDLSALLRRIGHLPMPKGVELARQLCSGLAAAHDAGMVHRDLKPANIMLDGRGRARITDFGLSGLAEEFHGEDNSGTPAYMAPEQLRGAPATAASDNYALGLVLYEIFTGKRPFEGGSIREIRHQQERDVPPPSSRIRDIDPLVERAILRCLARNPADRPVSAYDLASALPGGDPLAAAIAAGETPSPRMVAASGRHEGLRPFQAWTILGFIVAVIAAVSWIFNPAVTATTVLQQSPEDLAHKAKDVLSGIGYTAPPADSAFGLEIDRSVRDWNRRQPTDAGSSSEWVQFWYRESPETLMPGSLHPIGPIYALPATRVSEKDPPPLVPGMRSIRLDTSNGLLRELQVVPAREAAQDRPPLDWNFLLKEAGLDPQSLTPAQLEQMSTLQGDQQVAWTGTWPGRPDLPLRVEGAAQEKMPIYFKVSGPWSGSTPASEASPLTIVVVIFVMITGISLAWRNLNDGRGDRRGAFRLALFAFASLMVAWICASTHGFDPRELDLFLVALGEALYWSVLAGILYLAVEPFVRQRWPHALISWNRILEGRFGDSLVGRDVLVGIGFAGAVCVVRTSLNLLDVTPQQYPEPDVLQAMQSAPAAIAFLSSKLFDSANVSISLFFLFCFLRVVLRNQWIAIAIWIGLINFLTSDPEIAGAIVVVAFGALWLLAVMRFGLTAGIAMWFADRILRIESMLAPQGWLAGSYYLLLGAVTALALYAFVKSLGNHPVFALTLMDAKE
jgi:serine/threonine-protein kinase